MPTFLDPSLVNAELEPKGEIGFDEETPTKPSKQFDADIVNSMIPETEDIKELPAVSPEVRILNEIGIDSSNVTDIISGKSGMGRKITGEDIRKLADHFNLPPKHIRTMIRYYRGNLEPAEKETLVETFGDMTDTAVGYVSMLLGDAPAWMSKKIEGAVGGEQVEKAWDVAEELSRRRKSMGQVGAETVASMALPIGVGAKLLTKPASLLGRVGQTAKTAAGLSALGAGYGLFASKRGRELPAMAVGAAAGPMLGIAVPGLVKGVGKVVGAGVNKLVSTKPLATISKDITAKLDAQKYAEDVMYQLGRGKKVDDIDHGKLVSQLKLKRKDINKVVAERDISAEEAIEAIVTDKGKKEFVQFATEYLPQISQVNKALMKSGVDLQEALAKNDTAAIKIFVDDLKLPKEHADELATMLAKDLSEQGKEKLLISIGNSLQKQGRERDVVKSVDALNDYVDEVEKSTGETIRNTWDQFRFGTEVNKRVQGLNRSTGKAGSKLVDKQNRLDRAISFISTAQHKLDAMDHKFGLDTGYHNMRLNNGLESAKRFNEDMGEKFLKPFTDDLKRLTKGKSDWDEKLFYEYAENPSKLRNKVPDYYETLLNKHVKAYSEMPAEFKTRGHNIPLRENYIPHRMKDRDVIRTNIWDSWDKYDQYISTQEMPGKKVFDRLMDKDIPGAEGKEFRQFVQGVLTLADIEKSSKQWKKLNWEKLTDIVNRVQNDPMVNNRIARINTANYKRKGEIPKFLRETDPVKLMAGWIQENNRYVETREPMREILKWVKPLEKLGAEQEAEFLKFHLNKAAGYNRGWWEQNIREGTSKRYSDLIDKNIPPGITREIAKGVPTSLGHGMNMVYGSLLSNPRSAIRNLTQPIVLTAEEIGDTYGRELYLRSVLPAVYTMGSSASRRIMSKGPLRKIGEFGQRATSKIDELERKGKLPRTQRLEAIDTGRAGAIGKVTTGINDLLLYPFTRADRLNRITTVGMARNIIGDAKLGRKEAVEYLMKKLSTPAIREKMGKAIKGGKWDDATDMLEDHLLQKTQFVYNKNNQSEFANTVGPLFSMFSRWPTEIIGDIVTKTKMGDAERAFTKYVGPLAYLSLLDRVISANENIFDKKKTKVFPGPMGFSGQAPITNLGAFMYDDRGAIPILSAPHIRTVTDLLHALTGSEQATNRFLRDDLPNYIGVRAASNFMDTYPVLAGFKPYGIKEDWNKKARKWGKGINKSRENLNELLYDAFIKTPSKAIRKATK